MTMFIHFFCFCPRSLAMKLNFNISKVAYCDKLDVTQLSSSRLTNKMPRWILISVQSFLVLRQSLRSFLMLTVKVFWMKYLLTLVTIVWKSLYLLYFWVKGLFVYPYIRSPLSWAHNWGGHTWPDHSQASSYKRLMSKTHSIDTPAFVERRNT